MLLARLFKVISTPGSCTNMQAYCYARNVYCCSIKFLRYFLLRTFTDSLEMRIDTKGLVMDGQ